MLLYCKSPGIFLLNSVAGGRGSEVSVKQNNDKEKRRCSSLIKVHLQFKYSGLNFSPKAKLSSQANGVNIRILSFAFASQVVPRFKAG